jgi:general secretion pathway protein M
MKAVARWDAMAPRERTGVAVAMAVVGAALLWLIAIAPALAVLRTAEEQHRGLDAQLREMRGKRALAESLRAQPRLGSDEALRALELSVRQQLGVVARISIAGDRATVTLTGAPADALAQWLTQTRINARVLPVEARLARNPGGLWDGTLVMVLPVR